jgi:hypothetical protein
MNGPARSRRFRYLDRGDLFQLEKAFEPVQEQVAFRSGVLDSHEMDRHSWIKIMPFRSPGLNDVQMSLKFV